MKRELKGCDMLRKKKKRNEKKETKRSIYKVAEMEDHKRDEVRRQDGGKEGWRESYEKEKY